LARVLTRAFVLPWEQRGQLYRAVILPLALLIFLSLAELLFLFPASRMISWVWEISYLLCVSWLAVRIHRTILIAPHETHEVVHAAYWRRIVLYAIAIAALWMLFVCVMFAVRSIGMALQPAEPYADLQGAMQKLRVAVASIFVAATLVTLVSGRVCLLLPAIAIDADAATALRAARGNTLRLAVVFSVLPGLLAVLNHALFDESSTVAGFVFLSVFGAIFLVIEVTALSLSWRELTSPAPPPTDPRV
jgi:hypothetical protein